MKLQIPLLTVLFALLPFTVMAGERGIDPADQATPPLKLQLPGEEKAYSGAYIDFGDREDTVTLEAIEHYDALTGKRQAMIAFSSDWGNGMFPHKQLKIIDAYGAVPVIYWSPWDRPLGAPSARNRFALERILAGDWDQYIDAWSKQASDFRKPMLIAWGLEMNGNWFPWSGYFYGGGAPQEGMKDAFEGPETFKRAYRYVVDRVRKNGATNIQWIFHANNTSDPDKSWNRMANYYPGDEYVDWLGLSAYGMQYPDQGWPIVESVLSKPYKELITINSDKPVILAEWGIGEFPNAGSKAAWLGEIFGKMQKECPRIKAAVYWHERWQNGDLSYSNLRVNSSPEALAAFKRGIASDFWLDRPQLSAGKGL